MGVLKAKIGNDWVPVTGPSATPLPVGGLTGQVLTKKSATNFDTQWSGPAISQYTADTKWHEIGAAGEPAYQNGWSTFDNTWQSPAFRIDAEGWVYLKGMMKGGTNSAVAFNLPVGYRPWKNIFVPALSQEGINAYYQIYADGNVVPVLMGAGTNGWFTLEMGRFPVWNTWAQHVGKYFPLEGQELRGSYAEYLTGLWPQPNGMTRIMGICGALPAAGTMTRVNDLGPAIHSYMFGCASGDTGGGKGGQISKRLGFYSMGASTSYTMFSTEFGTPTCEDRWIPFAYENSWRDFGSDVNNWHAPGGYWKDAAGVVHVRGLVAGGTSSNVTVATLPVGYRPPKHMLWYGVSAAGSACRTEIHSDGVVMAWTGAHTGWQSFNGMNFYAAEA